jgi:hypothetical protein
MYPVGRRPVHATTAPGLTESVPPSSTEMRVVRLAVAVTIHSFSNDVTQSAPFMLIGTTLTISAPERADSGATSTFAETALTGAAQGMCVRNGRDESANHARPLVATRSSEPRSRRKKPFLRRRTASPRQAAGWPRPAR